MASSTSAHISEGSSQLQPAPIASPYPRTDRAPAEDIVERPLNSTISEPSNKPSISEFVWLQENDTPLSEAPFRFMALPKELRITIYELNCHQLLHDISLRVLPITVRSPYQDVWQSNLRSVFKEMLALLHASRTLRDEGVGVYRKVADRGLREQEENYERLLEWAEKEDMLSWYMPSSQVAKECMKMRACADDVRRIRALLEQVYEEHGRIQGEADQAGEV